MSIYQRVADIVTANLNDLADRYENPERMLRQAIREMEHAESSVIEGAVHAVAHEKRLVREIADGRTQMERWNGRARRAVEAGDDANARHALARQLDSSEAIERLEEQHSAAAELTQSLKRRIEEMRSRLTQARRVLAELTTRKAVAHARKSLLKASRIRLGDSVSTERWMARMQQSEDEVAAWAEMLGESEDALGPDDREEQIDRDLASLKESRGG